MEGKMIQVSDHVFQTKEDAEMYLSLIGKDSHPRTVDQTKSGQWAVFERDVPRCEKCGDPYCVETIDVHGYCDTCRPPVIPTACGRRHGTADGDYSYRWMLLSREAVATWLLDKPYHGMETTREREDLAQALTGWYRDYSGPGRWFWHEPYMKITRTRILIKQVGGLDI